MGGSELPGPPSFEVCAWLSQPRVPPSVLAGVVMKLACFGRSARPPEVCGLHSGVMSVAGDLTFRQRFNMLADKLTAALGTVWALVGSVLLVVVWALTGPVFGFSDTWQLFINTSTTVVTFWMVFVIQNSANRQGKATQLKLDEIIRSLADARDEFVALDRATDEVLAKHEKEFIDLVATEADDPQPAQAPDQPSMSGQLSDSPRS